MSNSRRPRLTIWLPLLVMLCPALQITANKTSITNTRNTTSDNWGFHNASHEGFHPIGKQPVDHESSIRFSGGFHTELKIPHEPPELGSSKSGIDHSGFQPGVRLAEGFSGLMGPAGIDPHVLSSGWHSGSECTCWNGTSDTDDVECRCRGDKLMEVPANLSTITARLTIANAGIEVLKSSSLQPYRTTLRDVTLMNVRHLRSLEPGAFYSLDKLRTIYIYKAPQLVTIDVRVFQVNLPSLRILRVVHTGIREVPRLSDLHTKSILHMVDLDNNQIHKIPSRTISVKAEQLLLNYNEITEVEAHAFEGSQVGKLSLKGNRALTELHSEAFVGLASLRTLDLSETSITQLPTRGLLELDVLRLTDTESLRTFPSIYNFEYIKEATLTYAYHCCAFRYPAAHDPAEYARHQEFIQKMERRCSEVTTANPGVVARQQRSASLESGGWGTLNESATGGWGPWGGASAGTGTGVRGAAGSREEEMFHQTNVTLSPVHALCGVLSKNYRDVACKPLPDAFSPCEDLMGNWWLRAAVWMVVVAAVLGNLAVLLVLISSRFRMTVPKFLMCNLALADLCMGTYLLLIAAMDARSIGAYFNHAIDWQQGAGCQIAGFLTVFASELSIFTLAVITCERWYTITYAIHLNRRLKLSTAARIMAAGWAYAILMAALPLLGISGYAKTSICLPMENKDVSDRAYLVTLLVFNGLAFVVICVCYARMYSSIRSGGGGRPGGGLGVVGATGAAAATTDLTVAKRMALLVFTDFACWAPIAFFGLTAVAGYPLIDVTDSKILLVFFYPLNSCANPYLYAILTKQYRRDLFILLSRYGFCSQRAARYKGASGSYAHHMGGMGARVGSLGGKGNKCDRQEGAVTNSSGCVAYASAPAPLLDLHRGSLLLTQHSTIDVDQREAHEAALAKLEYDNTDHEELKNLTDIIIPSSNGMKHSIELELQPVINSNHSPI